MSSRMIFVVVASVGFLGAGAARSFAASPLPSERPKVLNMEDDEKNGKGEKSEKDEKEEKDEQKIAVDKLPAAVVETVKKELPDGKITEAEAEQKDGKTVYEIDVKSGDIAYELKTAGDGTFISKKVDDDKDEDDKK